MARISGEVMVSEGPVGRGTCFIAEPKSMGGRGEMTVEVTEYDRPHGLYNVIRSSYMQVDGTLTFEEADGGTRLRWDWDIGLVGLGQRRSSASPGTTRACRHRRAARNRSGRSS